MNLRPFAFVTLAFLAFATFARADNYPHKESFSRSGAFSPTGTVSLENVNGNVTIEAWDRPEILIEGEKSAKTDEELKAIDLTIDLSDTNAGIKVRLPKRPGGWFGNNSLRGAVSFKLKVPATARLEEIKTVNASIRLSGLRGPVDAHTVNGRVEATDLGGDASLHTVNGRVNASFANIAAQQQLELETVNGSVHVALPSDAGVDFHGSVVNGRIHCDFPLQLTGKIGGKRVKGTIGDARASLRAQSVNGSIHLKKL